MVNKVKLRDIYVYAFPSRSVLLDFIKNEKKILVAVNAEKILNNNQKLHKIINENIAYSDGVGAVMAIKQKGLETVKIPGAEFWLDIIKKFEQEKSFYLVGSSSEVINQTVEKLKQDFPSIKIVGFRDGFLKSSDKEQLKNDLKEKQPDVVFVAQGSPRQEYLMDELLEEYPALYMGLGGSFDVYCGEKKRAPSLFIKYKLEWFYRLLKEPTRIGRQSVLVKFIFLLRMKKI